MEVKIDAKDTPPKKSEHKVPQGAHKKLKWKSPSGKTFQYEVRTEWMLLRKKERPAAEMFHTYYRMLDNKDKNRPITFVFNGGPGASSAYLHVGGLGPLRVYFESDGNLPAPPAELRNNPESWLAFTDLVFIDPVGTGFSSIVEGDEKTDAKDPKDPQKTVDEKEYYQLNRDLDSIAEFMERFLSKHKLWESPIYVAGESYGGYRTAKLARRLQEKYGIGLTAAIAISPALEWSLLNSHDYDVLHYVDSFCTMALAAAFHGKSRIFKKKNSIETMRKQIEEFASKDFSRLLVGGEHIPEKEWNSVLKKVADYLGLDSDLVIRCQGRIRFWRFAREILKESNEVIGFYDATIKAIDPFPDRESHEAPDPTLISIERIFTGGINQLIRCQIGLETDRRYHLLSEEVNLAWKRDEQKHVFDTAVGATDDLRFAMSMNPHMKVLITHGYYDMVTPYFSTERLVSQMRLLPSQKKNIFIRHFGGGHMFYTWDESRKAFTSWVKEIYES
ncbi:MAG: S10 family peptidase [Pseudobdellovibrionaceae bacterium]